MDVATLVGVVSGFACVIVAIFLGGGIGIFFNVPSLMITVGGTIAATLMNFPLANVLGVFRIAKKCFLNQLMSPVDAIRQITEYARIARRDGILALEERLGDDADPFLRRGLQLVIDGTSPEAVRDILTSQLEARRERHARGKKILESMGASAPAFGMIGTLIGLVQMLRQLSDPSQIGVGMATALITTFYGAVMANLVFLPLAGKLEASSQDEALLTELLIEGVVCIQNGENPRAIEDRLKSYIAPSLYAELDQRTEARAA
ncbi:MAG: flagellar motor protein [Candidatus Brocadiia bacterium]